MRALLAAATFLLVAAAPFPTIPPDGDPFYVSDSYSVALSGAPMTVVPTGAFEQWGTWAAGTTAYVYLTDASLAILPLFGSANDGVNIDGQVGIYSVAGGPAVYTGLLAELTAPYVPGSRPSQIINATAKPGLGYRAVRNWTEDRPLRLVAKMPASGGPYQIGWVFTIHKGGNSGTLQMEHHIQGVIATQ